MTRFRRATHTVLRETLFFLAFTGAVLLTMTLASRSLHG